MQKFCGKINIDAFTLLCAEGTTLTAEDIAAVKAALADGVRAMSLRSPIGGGYVDPITLAPTAAENGCLLIEKGLFDSVGGEDGRMGAAAATDLLLRVKLLDGSARYLPTVYGKAAERSYCDRLLSTLKLRIKFGTKSDIFEGALLVLKAFAHPTDYGCPRGELVGGCFCSLLPCLSLLLGRLGRGKAYKNTKTDWYGADPVLPRGKAPREGSLDGPLVSLIVRTRHRPETLRVTLESLRWQSYKNFEIVLIEDGEPQSERMVREDFSDLPIVYHATQINIGRAAAFNKGLSLAKGEFINMLDDDDYLLPEHIELAVAKLCGSGADMLFANSVALEGEKLSDEPYKFEVKSLRELVFPRVDVFTMVRRCVTTDNGITTRRSLCLEVGGMREELGAHEDWNLWLRLMTKAKIARLPYITNCYYVPADKQAEQKRLAGYAKWNDQLLEDDTLEYSLTAGELREFKNSMVHDYCYLLSLGLLPETLGREAAEAAEFLQKRKIRPAEFSLYLDSGQSDDDSFVLSGREIKELYMSEILRYKALYDEGKLADELTSCLAALK